MIECKSCKHKHGYSERLCPICGAPVSPTQEELRDVRRALDRAIAEKDQEYVLTYRCFLADMNDTDSQREYAKLVEKSAASPAEIDRAMKYYKLAAEDNDPYSAYKYSRLVERTSTAAAVFWLKYSAVLGSIDSYPDVSDLFSSEGNEEIAAYYRNLAAACDDTDSIVNMARRFADGIGVEKNEQYAKWYLDKLLMPPISAIKLAYKLRSVKSKEPAKITFPDYDKHLRTLAADAKKYSFNKAYFTITELLYKRGDPNAEVTLGILCTEGIGCAVNLDRAMRCFTYSISRGNPVGAAYLGRLYMTGKLLERNVELAMKYFKRAADLGYASAYEEMGDIYNTGNGVEIDVARAVEFYDLAAMGGVSSAAEKSKQIKTRRTELYNTGSEIISRTGSVRIDEAELAFRTLAIATAMGEGRAPRLLAKCYAYGFGTEKDRPRAYFWFERAAEGGDAEAYLPLGLCYSRGFGTAFSFKCAVKYLKLAAERGSTYAAEELNTLYRRKMKKMVRSLYSTSMHLIYLNKYDEAVQLLKSFESLSYPKALYTLGCLYEFGRGVGASDRSTANKYYDLAAAGSPVYGSFSDERSRYKLCILKLLR